THTYDVDVLVIGSGPGGYTAAFRAADLGLKVCMIERYPQIGGVCLNVGCIPSKALLHTARVLDEASAASHMGVQFGSPKIELDRLRQWKNGVTTKLNKGLAGMAKQRKVNVLTGRAVFASDHSVRVEGNGGSSVISFANAIIACGSRPIIPGPLRVAHEALIDSTGALELRLVPPKMLIVGGGIIGLEMATVYRALGSEITVVEMSEQLIPEADTDVVKVLDKRLRAAGVDIRLATSVVSLAAKGKQLQAQLSGTPAPTEVYDSVLVATGRAPNGLDVGAEHAGVTVDERGYIPADLQMRTNVGHIFSIGDVRGQPMLAHKATHEGKLAAEIIAGATNAIFDARCIPAVAYTDPELAWAGLSEKEAKRQGIAYDKAVFPFAASGRALSMDRTEGMTKLLFSRDTSKHLLGAAIVGPSAGDLIAEVALALEMGATAEDLAMTIHAHPTLSESINFAAEIAEGTITDLYLPRR
nr:dihydrolipoyl dehydrogenase [Pseudomonadota bacterium]